MTEELVRLSVGGEVALYGKYRPAAAGAPLVVLVHGLTSHMDVALHYNAARHLSAEGFAVLRFNLYGAEPDTRRLTECTTSQHARDLDAVLRVMRARTPDVPIYVVGHSLGGLTALLATEPFDGLVFWDAAHSAGSLLLQNLRYVDELGLYLWRQRIDHLLNPAMVEEMRALDSDALASRLAVPLLILAADDKGRPELSQRYADHAGGPVELHIVPGSDHTFSLGESASVVYDETVRWLRGR